MNWSWLSFVVGVLVGWLIEWVIDLVYWRRKYRDQERVNADLREQVERAQGRERELEKQAVLCTQDLEACQADLDASRADLETCRADLAAAEAFVKETATRAAAVVPIAAGEEAPKEQDLTKVEGIGPKISGLLHDAGILNFELLAAAPVERLKEILDAAGSRYRMADPSTWPQQARLAAEEKWDELDALQDRLSGGRA